MSGTALLRTCNRSVGIIVCMMDNEKNIFDTDKIFRLLMKTAPPVMLAQLIQALYNIVDSFFIGRYSGDALTALSVVFPIQLLSSSIAIGTAVGVNILIARFLATEREKDAENVAGTGLLLAILSWIVFIGVSFLILNIYIPFSVEAPEAQRYAFIYGRIVCAGSIGIFLESTWSKILQARGNMKRPMAAQITGALVNIGLDPILIFGVGRFEGWGIAGAAIATVIGQIVAAVITGRKGFYRIPQFAVARSFIPTIYKAALPNIIMQVLYSVYIAGLNLVLARFGDAAVTVLGLYYKLQTFFFIPTIALETCVMPIFSYNYAREKLLRCKKIFWVSEGISVVCLAVACILFVVIPVPLLQIFSNNPEVLTVGETALKIIGPSFLPASIGFLSVTFFQATGKPVQSIVLTLMRQVFLLVPVAWALAFLGVDYVWFTYPITETVVGVTGYLLYWKMTKGWKAPKMESATPK